MNDLNTTTKLVKAILKQDERARNSDSFLYLRVIEHIADQNGINLYGISIPLFLITMKENGFPPFESVRRTRQKAQAENPELAPCEKVAAYRAEQEKEYRAYALQKG